MTDALARAYRLSLGTGVVRGARTRLFNDTMDLRLGIGQRGALAGGPYPGFHDSNGTLAWAGYSQRLTESSYAGAQLSRATGLFPALLTLVPEAIQSVTSGAAAIGTSGEWQGVGRYGSRLTLVTSKVEGGLPGDKPRGNGLFVEASLQSGRQRHEFGLYKADPNLRFGDNPLLADNRGRLLANGREQPALQLGTGTHRRGFQPLPGRGAAGRTLVRRQRQRPAPVRT